MKTPLNPLNIYKVYNWHKKHKRELTVGQRSADLLRNGMGSWSFVFLFIIFMIIWAYINTAPGWHHWDKYPFILLNLFLSMIAGLQGAILLIAAKRQDAIAGAMAEHDYQTNLRSKKEIEELMAINQRQVEMIEDLKKLLERQNHQLTTGQQPHHEPSQVIPTAESTQTETAAPL